jgi:hypothetical protein
LVIFDRTGVDWISDKGIQMAIPNEVGIPFIGQNGFYPNWAKGSGRWVFQRTLAYVEGPLGLGQLVELDVPVATQVIVWVPAKRGIAYWFGTQALHDERNSAVNQLERMPLRCYGKGCRAVRKRGLAKGAVIEQGVYPERWFLACPFCNGRLGPDLDHVRIDVIVAHWKGSGGPALDNPAAGPDWSSASQIPDLPAWIQKSDPSPLEVAYLGQQLWPSLCDMLAASTGE